jgi:hypothetical protein
MNPSTGGLAGAGLAPVSAAFLLNHALVPSPVLSKVVSSANPVEQLAAQGADPSLGDYVRPGRLRRRAQDADAFVANTASKTAVKGMSRSRITKVN